MVKDFLNNKREDNIYYKRDSQNVSWNFWRESNKLKQYESQVKIVGNFPEFISTEIANNKMLSILLENTTSE